MAGGIDVQDEYGFFDSILAALFARPLAIFSTLSQRTSVYIQQFFAILSRSELIFVILSALKFSRGNDMENNSRGVNRNE